MQYTFVQVSSSGKCVSFHVVTSGTHESNLVSLGPGHVSITQRIPALVDG